MKSKTKLKNTFERFALGATRATGSTAAFIISCAVILSWLITGPIFRFSDTWQLVINTATSIITFLMVFLIQKTQNKDSLAIQLKLNELVAANNAASNRLIDVEDLSEDDLLILTRYYTKLVELAKKDIKLHQSHSIEEAIGKHEKKEAFTGIKKQ